LLSSLLVPLHDLVTITAVARDLCADSADNKEYVRACAEMVIDLSGGLLSNDVDKDRLIEFLGEPLVPEVDPDAPLSDDLRKALFAAYGDAFRDTTDEARYTFTRLVLGLSDDVPVSWTNRREHAISNFEAGLVLNSLRALV